MHALFTLVLISQAPIDFDEPAATEPPPIPIAASTPSAHLEAALLMRRVGRPDVTRDQIRGILKPLRSGDLSDADLRQLRRDYGTSAFLRLARDPEVQPEGALLLDAVLAAIEGQSADSGYTAGLVTDLAGRGDARKAAEAEARRLGPKIVGPLLGLLPGADESTRRGVMRGLIAAGPEAADALGAVAFEATGTAKAFATAALAENAEPDGVLPLIAAEADPFTSPRLLEVVSAGLDRLPVAIRRVNPVRTLTREIRDTLTAPSRRGAPAVTTLYQWDRRNNVLTASTVSAEEARRVRALRIADALLRIAGDDADARRLVGVLRAEADDAFDPSLGAPADVLNEALELNASGAAVAAIRATQDTAEALAQNSPLLTALDHPDRDVQLAAAEQIVAFAPENAFAGADRVTEVLAAHIMQLGEASAVVIDPNTIRGGTTAGRIAQLGFEPLLAANGREGFTMAAERADVELIVVIPNIIRPDLTSTLTQLAADSRTSSIPVAIVARTSLRPQLTAALAANPRAVFVQQTEDVSFLKSQLAGLLPSGDGLRAKRRGEQRRAVAALQAVAQQDTSPMCLATHADVIIGGAYEADPEVGAGLAAVLVEIPTRESQTALTALVARGVSGAAAALKSHQNRYGRLIR